MTPRPERSAAHTWILAALREAFGSGAPNRIELIVEDGFATVNAGRKGSA